MLFARPDGRETSHDSDTCHQLSVLRSLAPWDAVLGLSPGDPDDHLGLEESIPKMGPDSSVRAGSNPSPESWVRAHTDPGPGFRNPRRADTWVH